MHEFKLHFICPQNGEVASAMAEQTVDRQHAGLKVECCAISQIELQIKLHCSSAFTLLKIDRLEQHIASLQHEEMFSVMYSRMNELDDMLDMVCCRLTAPSVPYLSFQPHRIIGCHPNTHAVSEHRRQGVAARAF